MYQKVVFPVLDALSYGDAERAHWLAMHIIQTAQRVPFLLRLVAWWCENVPPRPQAFTIGSVRFPSRVGLAAGLDKQALILPFLQAIGFGFVEIGSVLPRYQLGNARPRLAWLPGFDELWNCMGFNSDGVEVVAKRLAEVRGRIRIPIGISLGKQKETPLEKAVDDYREVLRAVAGDADFYVVNVSSPNTPGLRLLQGPGHLENLIALLVQAEAARAKEIAGRPKPVFVKIAPDLDDEEMDETIGAIVRANASAVVAGNTTTKRRYGFTPTKFFLDAQGQPRGGYSGPRLFDRTLAMTRFIRRYAPELPILACGGIASGADAVRALDAGANAVEILTGFLRQGPAFVRELRSSI